MSKFRKKPVVVEAVQWDGTEIGFHDLCKEFGLPLDAANAYRSDHGNLYMNPAGDFFIETLEGPRKVSSGEFVIQGVKGEYYPCKPDIFDHTYDADGKPTNDQHWINNLSKGIDDIMKIVTKTTEAQGDAHGALEMIEDTATKAVTRKLVPLEETGDSPE